MATSSASVPKRGRRPALKLSIPSAPNQTGSVFTCGQGDVGQLGLGADVTETTRYVYVRGLGDKIVDVCAGGRHTLALDSDGKVWSFGYNVEGALGRPTTEEGTPAKVKLPAKAVALSAGNTHSAALLQNGKVYAWGAFTDSHASMGLVLREKKGVMCHEPVLLDIGELAADIASGGEHLVILSTSGAVYTMGCGEQGQLGRLTPRSASRHARLGLKALLVPQKVCGLHKVTKIWAGYNATFTLDPAAEKMFAWGLNNHGQLGITAEKLQSVVYVPTQCDGFTQGSGWQRVVCGRYHSLALDSNGEVFAVGRCEHGSLGLADQQLVAKSLQPMAALAGKRCVSIAAGKYNSYAVTDDGEIFACGRGIQDHATLRAEEPSKITAGVQHTALLAMAVAATDYRDILDYLNEDCWKEVLDYLPVADIIRTERASRRWQNMVLVYLQRVRFHIQQNLIQRCSEARRPVTLKGLRSPSKLFRACTNKFGPSVVSICCPSESSLKMTEENCPNLEALKLSNLPSCLALEFNQLLSAVNHLSVLTKLEIIWCPRDISRQIHIVLDKLPNLEYLHFDGRMESDIGFESICRLRYLKYLNVNIESTDFNLEDVTRSCNQLQTLQLYDCSAVTGRGLEAVSRNLGLQLTSLGLRCSKHLRDDDVMDCISKCPNLTFLNLEHSSNLTRTLLRRIAEARRCMSANSELRMRVTGTCGGARYSDPDNSTSDDDYNTSDDDNSTTDDDNSTTDDDNSTTDDDNSTTDDDNSTSDDE